MKKKKKKRQNQSRIVDVIISFVFSIVVGYGLLTAFQLVGDDSKSYLERLTNYEDKFAWLMAADMMYKAPLMIVTVMCFVLMATMTRKKESGYKDASQHGAYGNAQFSTIDDVRESGYIASSKESKWSEKDPLKSLGVKEGIILGRDGDELFIIPNDTELDNRNVLVVGSSGSSKGQAFVINNIINNKSQSIIVTDPKGELHKLTSELKRDQGYQVEQIDFLNLKGSRYNPLDYVTNDIEAIKISNAISINSAKDVKQDFFFNTARDLLTGLIIYAKAEHEQPNISKTVKGLFNQIAQDETFLQELCESIGDDHPAFQYLKDASAQTGNTRASILSSFAQQTGVFSLEAVGNLTEKSDFSFRDLQKQKTILYVKIPVKDNPVPALTATFFDQLITTLYQIGDENGAVLKIPTIFLLDEFANLGKLNDFDNTLSTCRGYRMSIMTIVQDFAQLEEKYSKELARTIVNNHDTTLFLRTKDPETAKFFERLAGDTTIHYKTKSSSNSGGFLYVLGFGSSNPSKSVNEQYVKKPLISEGELLKMPKDKCYVFITGHVIELEKAYQSKLYNGFITAMEVVNGEKRFNYVYPRNRDAYIRRFKLTPFEEINEEVIESKLIDSQVNTKNESESTGKALERPPVVETLNSRELGINSIVSSFFEELEKKKTPVESKDDTSTEEVLAVPKASTTSSTSGGVALAESVDLAQLTVETVEEIVDSSDPNELEILKSVSKLPERIEQTNEELVDLYKVQSLVDGLRLSEGYEYKEPEETFDLTDELPM